MELLAGPILAWHTANPPMCAPSLEQLLKVNHLERKVVEKYDGWHDFTVRWDDGQVERLRVEINAQTGEACVVEHQLPGEKSGAEDPDRGGSGHPERSVL